MPQNRSRALFITNYAPDEILSGYKKLQGVIYAVDSGLNKCEELGLEPDYIIGDFDSVQPESLEKHPQATIIRHPSRKNETDSELAFRHALELGFITEMVICNRLEGRFDHSLALVQNLIFLHQKGIKARIESATQQVFFLNEFNELKVQPMSLLSLIPFSDLAVFCSSRGLAYPLNGLQIARHQSRGISNVCLEEEIEIQLQSGLVLAVLSPKDSA